MTNVSLPLFSGRTKKLHCLNSTPSLPSSAYHLQSVCKVFPIIVSDWNHPLFTPVWFERYIVRLLSCKDGSQMIRHPVLCPKHRPGGQAARRLSKALCVQGRVKPLIASRPGLLQDPPFCLTPHFLHCGCKVCVSHILVSYVSIILYHQQSHCSTFIWSKDWQCLLYVHGERHPQLEPRNTYFFLQWAS